MKGNILIIANAALNQTDSNGRNLARLLDCIPVENKSEFYVYGEPDFNECNNYYHVSDYDAFNSFIKRVKKDGRFKKKEVKDSNEFVKSIKGRKTPLKMLLREFIWKHGKWNNTYFKSWIDELNPKCIFVVAGDNCFLLELAIKISKERSIPIILYSTEEYPFKDYNYITKRVSLFYYILRRKLRKTYKKISKYVITGVFNTESLADAYKLEYGYKCYSIYQASNIDFVENYKLHGDIIVSYLGNLGLNRHKALIEIANEIGKQFHNVKLDVYGMTTDDVEKEMKKCPYVNLKGFVSYEEVVKIIHNSTLLVHAEYKDDFYTKDLKYAFSTKITDSVCSGTPFLIYAPIELIETQFLKEKNCAFVATNIEELIEQIRISLSSEIMRREKIIIAKIVKDKYFTNKGYIKNIIEEVVNESSAN